MRLKIVVVTLILWMGLIHQGYAASLSMTYAITISVAADAIDLVAVIDPMHFGVVNLNETIFSNQPGGNPRCTIQNAGYADVNFNVSASISGGWELGTAIDDVGPNRCVIAGIFTQPLTTIDDPYLLNSRDLVKADFSDNDVLGLMATTATSDQLARDNSLSDPDDYESVKGYHVVAIQNQDFRSLRFMVQTPTEDTIGTEQFFNIQIGAEIY